MRKRRRIRLVRVKAADRHYGFVRNVYNRGTPWQTTIGVAFYWGQPGLSLVWRRPRLGPPIDNRRERS